MRLSLGTRIPTDNMNVSNGYGYATQGMLDSLRRLGYHIEDNDTSADAEIWFDQPHHWNFQKDKYKIGYLPWESTELLPGWADIMNKCDEIWTPSPLIAGWYKDAGITVPVFVYEHGVDHIWEPRKRTVDGPLKFLHVGAEATRKGGWDTMRLFRTAFVGNKDVSLTLKLVGSGWNSINGLGKVHFINERYSFGQLQQLFYDHHVYVYPSWGEGFGLTPLQAMATGMPTITCPAWAPYADLLDPNLSIPSTLAKSSWPDIHPGYMLRPSFDDLVDRMRYAYENYDPALESAVDTAPRVHERYDWDRLTKEAFGNLENRLKNS